MNNVIQMTSNISTLDQLGDDLRALDARQADNKAEWVEISVALCAKLAQASDRFPSNNEFGEWRDALKLKLNRDDLKALTGLGSDLALARTILEETTSSSYQLIWREVKDRFPDSRRRSVTPTREKEGVRSIAKTPSSLSNKPKRDKYDQLSWSAKHPFFKLERGEEIATAFTHGDGPSGVVRLLARPGCAEIWAMILQCYDAGLLAENQYRPLNNAKYPSCSLRVLFPESPRTYANKFNLIDAKDRAHVRDVIIPAALAAGNEAIVHPDRLERIVENHASDKAVPVKAAPTPAPVKSVSKPVYENIGKPKYLSQQEVDPEFEGTPVEFTKLYGHVQIYNAEQFASLRFSYITDGFRELAKRWQQLDIDKRPIVHKWLRSPDSRDVTRLAEALELLRPQFAEAEKVLAIAQAILKKKEVAS